MHTHLHVLCSMLHKSVDRCHEKVTSPDGLISQDCSPCLQSTLWAELFDIILVLPGTGVKTLAISGLLLKSGLAKSWSIAIGVVLRDIDFRIRLHRPRGKVSRVKNGQTSLLLPISFLTSNMYFTPVAGHSLPVLAPVLSRCVASLGRP